ncbi:MAG TPA: methyltransferase [Polyangiaceae bacterium]|jgi:predicted O-methyltransferase YrrM|nr:methyltransferase [Polyangiaceae bacterium]
MDPSHIMQVGMGFWASKTLLSAVELELFTVLARTPLTAGGIVEALGIHPRAVPDFPDTLVALRLLAREGNGPTAVYSNTPEGALFLDKKSPAYIGGILEMANARLYRFWADLTPALQTGMPQNETKNGGESVFAKLYEVPERLEQFMSAMAGVSAGNFQMLAKKFDFSKYKTLCDVGGATGQLACFVAAANPELDCVSFDLPPVEPIAKRAIEAAGLSKRVKTAKGDFFTDALPRADVITMGMILHDWNLEKKKVLIRKAYDALPHGGAFIAIEALIDDARRENVFGLCMSLNMLVEFGDAFDYTATDFEGWCKEAGFSRFEVMPLAGPSSAVIAYK